MERKRIQNPELHQKYNEFMREYEELGHMQGARHIPNGVEKRIYITHHCLEPPRKFRVVFNALQKSSNAMTINEIQYAGPRLQSKLHEINTRFRLFPFAMTSDIIKMFRQVSIVPEQYDLQRILWRPTPS